MNDEDIGDDQVEGLDEGDLQVDPSGAPINLGKNDRSLAEFHRWHTKGRIVVDPEWQRKYVWDRRRASRLIESFLIDLPIPVIYLALNDEGKYEVIDGLQRLTSVFDFFNNKYPLTGLEILSDLNGMKFDQLSEELQGQLEDKTLRTFELAANTNKDLMFLIFERLNTGGMQGLRIKHSLN
jgi:uncharacterized protein with ParB-like and HNH nuclease domain